MGACMGAFFIPLPSLFLSYSSETVFPLGEGSATGYIYAVSQTFGFLLGLGSISFLDKENKWKVYTIYGAHCFFLLISILSICTTKEVLNRTNHELKQTLKQKEEEDSIIVYENK